MAGKSYIFVVNPGSASRKYALFLNGTKTANIHFELVDNKVVGNIESPNGNYSIKYSDGNLSNAPHRLLPLMEKYGLVDKDDKIIGIGVRIVAPSKQFINDQIINHKVLNDLENLRQEAPLHVKTVVLEIRHLMKRFPDVPIVGVSDSKFHANKPNYAKYYPIDLKIAEKFEILRYGFHGISVGSVIEKLKSNDNLISKTVVCHLGSGCSVTAVLDGKSVETTMGYSPLEGLMMSTRSGSMDATAAIVLQENLKLTNIRLEQYLDKEAGLLGVSGSSDDIRRLVASEKNGDDRAKLALDMFVYKIQQAIGQMASAMNGIGCIVFTGTVGERSSIIRKRVVKNLSYLNFVIDNDLNKQAYEPKDTFNVASIESKPILVVSTDEANEIAKRTETFFKK